MADRIADLTLWNYTGGTYCTSILWNFLETYLPEVARNILSRMFQILALYSVGKAEICNRLPREYMAPGANFFYPKISLQAFLRNKNWGYAINKRKLV